MLTRCPACETHFRVTAEQLKARAGRVRCGECQHLFNALDSLIEESMAVAAPLASEPPPTSLAITLVDMEQDVAASSEATTAEVAVPPAPILEPAPEPAEAPEAAAADSDGGDWSETFPQPLPPPRRWPWAIGSAVALAALGMQAALAFRVELAVLMPEARPALVALCEIGDCKVGLPTKVALVGIEASDLYPDSGHAGRLTLTATLKNRAPFAQQFPHLELTLTDIADKAIARKVMAPEDYLPPKTSFAEGMRPGADITLAAGVDPGEIKASGYRLYLFYP